MMNLTVLRKIKKDKFSFSINLLGLSIAMTCMVFIFFWVQSEKSYDNFWEEAGQVYRVALVKSKDGSEISNTAMNLRGVSPVLLNELPEIEAATTLNKDIITVFTPLGSMQNINMFFSDPSFFNVFPRQIECENPDQLLTSIHDAVMSRSLAQKLFGEANPLNKSFKLNEGWEFNVVGVFDDVPENSHIAFDLILHQRALRYYMRNFNNATGVLDLGNLPTYADPDPYSQGQWGSTRTYSYIKLKRGSSIEQVGSKYKAAITPCIQHLVANGEDVHFEFQPIKDIHLHSNKDNELKANGSFMKVAAFSLIAFILMLTAYLNYANISVSNFINQAAAYNLKQIMGAKRFHIFTDYFIESLFTHFAAGLIALCICLFFISNGITIAGFSIQPVHPLVQIVTCSIMVLGGAFVTALYPFLSISVLQRNTKKTGKLKNKQDGRAMKGLVVFQFAASIFLIIGTMIIFRQLLFMQKTKTGMDMEQVMASFSPMTMIKKPDEVDKLLTFRNEVLKLPGVTGFTTAEIKAGKAYDRKSNKVRLPNNEPIDIPFALASIDFDYIRFFNIGITEGENFSPNFPYDGSEILVNQKTCEHLNLNPQEAVGQTLQIDNNHFRINGVVANHHHLSLKSHIEPVIYFKSLKWFRTVGFYYVKISTLNQAETIKRVSKLWSTIYPDEEYNFSFLDEQYNQRYMEDIHFGRVFMLLSVMTIFIACMGLFALARFMSMSKTKEIGIRKVNGARISEVLVMLNKDFVKWVAIAFVIATPIAYYAMNKWLQNFAYKTELSWWIFALAGLMALGIALLTVSWQSWRAARRNPVEALRYE